MIAAQPIKITRISLLFVPRKNFRRLVFFSPVWWSRSARKKTFQNEVYFQPSDGAFQYLSFSLLWFFCFHVDFFFVRSLFSVPVEKCLLGKIQLLFLEKMWHANRFDWNAVRRWQCVSCNWDFPRGTDKIERCVKVAAPIQLQNALYIYDINTTGCSCGCQCVGGSTSRFVLVFEALKSPSHSPLLLLLSTMCVGGKKSKMWTKRQQRRMEKYWKWTFRT